MKKITSHKSNLSQFHKQQRTNVYEDLSDVYCCGWSIDPTLNLDIFFGGSKKGIMKRAMKSK
jgi:hypothetical protein